MVLIDPAACLIRSSASGVPTWLMLALGAYPAIGGRLAGLIARSKGTEAMVVDALRRAYAGPIDPGFLQAHVDLEAQRAGQRTPYRGYMEAPHSFLDATLAWLQQAPAPDPAAR